MSQDMQLTISARDNASRVVEGVEKRVKNFGMQFGQQLAGMLAPMALVGMAIGKIGEHIEKIRQQRKEAFDWGASLQLSANKMGVTVETFQAVEAAADATGESVENVGKAYKMASDLIAAAKEGNLAAAESLSALGVKLENIEKTSPQEVLRRLAAALATTEDPAKRAQLAIAALGKEAGALQAVLAKGFDIAGAMLDVEGLTNEEAEFLRSQQRKERATKNRERLASARQQATEAFLENTPEGKDILRREQERMRALAGPAAGQAAAAGFGINATTASADPRIQAIVLEAMRKASQAAAAGRPGPDAAAAAALTAKDEADAKKAAEAAAKESTKKPRKGPSTKPSDFSDIFEKRQATVSSLREIGGGIAGEIAGTVDYQRNVLEVQKQIRDILAEINRKGGVEKTDFTKPVPNVVPTPSLVPTFPGLGGSSGSRMIA